MNKIKAYRITSRTYPEEGPVYLLNKALFYELAGAERALRFLVEEVVLGLPDHAEAGGFDPDAAVIVEPLIDVGGIPYTLDELVEAGGARVLSASEYRPEGGTDPGSEVAA